MKNKSYTFELKDGVVRIKPITGYKKETGGRFEDKSPEIKRAPKNKKEVKKDELL